MKINSKRLAIDIRKNIYDKLVKQAELKNQNITKYVESLITKQEKFNLKTIKAIENANNILTTHIKTYTALNAAISNLNQMMYFLNINELFTREEILDILQLVKVCVIENKQATKSIIETIKPYTKNSKQSKKCKSDDVNKQGEIKDIL